MKKQISNGLFIIGSLLIAGTVGDADVHPHAPLSEFVATAIGGFGCIGIGALLRREKPTKVTATIEVLTPVGGTYCRNPYRR